MTFGWISCCCESCVTLLGTATGVDPSTIPPWTFGVTPGVPEAWTSLTSAETEDSNYATVQPASTITNPDWVFGPERYFGAPQVVEFRNFGFSIPTSATIDNITITLRWDLISASHTPQAWEHQVGLNHPTNGLSDTNGSNLATDGPYTTEYISDASLDVLWGESWTPSDINSSSFGVDFQTWGYRGAFPSPPDWMETRLYWLKVKVCYS